MIGRFISIALAAMLAGVWAGPAAADKAAPPDPQATVCELEWTASFGKVELKQEFTGAGALFQENLQINRAIPASGHWGSISLSQSVFVSGGAKSASQSYFLGLTGPYGKGKNQRLVIAMPDGQPLTMPMEYGAIMIPISPVDLARIIGAGQRLNYRMIKVDQSGRETKLLAEGWLDLSGFAGLTMAGLPESATHARAVLAQARAGANPPCALASAAEMNAMESDEPVRKWLSLDCNESWDGPMGSFGLSTTGFSWRPRSRDGVMISLAATIRPAPTTPLQRFIIDSSDAYRYGPITVMLGKQDWGANYQTNDPALRERQSIELRRGQYVARKWLSAGGSAPLLWSEFAQISAGEGDLQITAYDKVSGATLRSSLPWADVLAAEEELLAGQARLRDRERDPMARCKAVIGAEFGGEAIIVT